jgi:hypothetical protein
MLANARIARVNHPWTISRENPRARARAANDPH